ncbi:MAG TPA: hypothetical protein VIH58_11525, partial [Chthoniobacterales bacterium]
MALVNKIFCGLAAAGALFFVIAVVLTFSQIGQNPDGGKGMGIVSGGLLPFLLLGIISFVFWKTNSPILHIILLIAVIVPAVLLVEQWLSGPLMDRDIAVGGYLYKDPAMRKFVASVANLDVKKARELAPRVDVNAPGENGVTPLKFAI